MASTTGDSGKAAATESQLPDHTPCINLFPVDLALRVLLFASTVVAIVLIATSEETEPVLSPLLRVTVPNTAKFKNSPALIYLLVAMCVACFYSIISILASFSAVSKPAPSNFLLLVLAFFDALLTGVVASALGAAGGVSYVGLKGNSHVGWSKICNVYDKFCRHTAGYLAMALLASVLLVFLLMVSTFSLYRRSR